MDEPSGDERRQGGRIVDLRLRLAGRPVHGLTRALAGALREDDVVLSCEDREVEVALARTSEEHARLAVAPRLRAALEPHHVSCGVRVRG